MRLADRDVRSALELVWDAAEYRGRDPFPHEFLERLAALIPADAIVGYHEVEARPPWRAVEAVEIPAEGVPGEFQEAAKPFCPEDPLQNGILRSERFEALGLPDATRDAEAWPVPVRVEAAWDR